MKKLLPKDKHIESLPTTKAIKNLPPSKKEKYFPDINNLNIKIKVPKKDLVGQIVQVASKINHYQQRTDINHSQIAFFIKENKEFNEDLNKKNSPSHNNTSPIKATSSENQVDEGIHKTCKDLITQYQKRNYKIPSFDNNHNLFNSNPLLEKSKDIGRFYDIKLSQQKSRKRRVIRDKNEVYLQRLQGITHKLKENSTKLLEPANPEEVLLQQERLKRILLRQETLRKNTFDSTELNEEEKKALSYRLKSENHELKKDINLLTQSLQEILPKTKIFRKKNTMAPSSKELTRSFKFSNYINNNNNNNINTITTTADHYTSNQNNDNDNDNDDDNNEKLGYKRLKSNNILISNHRKSVLMPILNPNLLISPEHNSKFKPINTEPNLYKHKRPSRNLLNPSISAFKPKRPLHTFHDKINSFTQDINTKTRKEALNELYDFVQENDYNTYRTTLNQYYRKYNKRTKSNLSYKTNNTTPSQAFINDLTHHFKNIKTIVENNTDDWEKCNTRYNRIGKRDHIEDKLSRMEPLDNELSKFNYLFIKKSIINEKYT